MKPKPIEIMTAKAPIDLKNEALSYLETTEMEFDSYEVEALGKRFEYIAERVEAQTIERIIEENLCAKKIGKWPRLYGPKSDKEHKRYCKDNRDIDNKWKCICGIEL